MTIVVGGVSVIALAILYFVVTGHALPSDLSGGSIAAGLLSLIVGLGQSRNRRSGGKRPNPIGLRTVTLLFALVALLTAVNGIALAFQGPTRFSRAIIVTTRGACNAGALVARTADAVYLGDGRRHLLVSLRNDEASDLIIQRQSLDVAKSTVESVGCPATAGG